MAQTFSMWSTKWLSGVALVNITNGENFTGNGSTFMYIEISFIKLCEIAIFVCYFFASHSAGGLLDKPGNQRQVWRTSLINIKYFYEIR